MYELAIKIINTDDYECDKRVGAATNTDNDKSERLTKSFCGNVYLHCRHYSKHQEASSVSHTISHQIGVLITHLRLMKLFMALAASLLRCAYVERHTERLINLTPSRNGFLICYWSVSPCLSHSFSHSLDLLRFDGVGELGKVCQVEWENQIRIDVN